MHHHANSLVPTEFLKHLTDKQSGDYFQWRINPEEEETSGCDSHTEHVSRHFIDDNKTTEYQRTDPLSEQLPV